MVNKLMGRWIKEIMVFYIAEEIILHISLLFR